MSLTIQMGLAVFGAALLIMLFLIYRRLIPSIPERTAHRAMEGVPSVSKSEPNVQELKTQAALDQQTGSVTILLGEEGNSDDPIIEIRPAFQLEGMPLGKTSHMGDMDSRLNKALVAARPILQELVRANGTRYIMRFSPRVAAALAKGDSTIVGARGGGLRAIARARNGQFMGNAVLLEGGITGPEAALLVWEIAAMITLQKYLSDISKALHRIEMALDEIRAKMEDKDHGQLSEGFETVRRVVGELQHGRFSQAEAAAYLVQLDTIELQCGQLSASSLRECQRVKAQFGELQKNYPEEWKEREEEAVRLLTSFGQSEYKAIVGHLVAGGAAHTRSLLASSPASLKGRIDDRIKGIRELDKIHGTFKEECTSRLDTIQGEFSMPKTDKVYRERFTFASELYLRDLSGMLATTEGYLKEMSEDISGKQLMPAPIALAVTLTANGEISELVALPAGS